jgi:signal transduction histidine kinase/tetratricopeptide (TPR) repeat protein
LGFGLCLLLAMLLLGCKPSTDSEVIYKKSEAVPLDATCKYLKDSKNFKSPSYMPTFYKYYNKKIKEKDYTFAFRALEMVLWNNDFANVFTEETLETANKLAAPYLDKLPKSETSFLYSFSGTFYSRKGDFKTAIEFYKKVDSVEVFNYKTCSQKSFCCQGLAWCYYRLGKQDQALAYSFKSLEYIKKTDTQMLTPGVYSVISAIYQSLKDYKNAELYIDKTIEFFKKDGDNEMARDNTFIMLYNKMSLLDLCGKTTQRAKLLDSTYLAYKNNNFSHPSTKIVINSLYVKKLINENKLMEAKAILDELAPEVKTLNYDDPNKKYAVAVAQYEITKSQKTLNKKYILDVIPSLLEEEDYSNVNEMYGVLHEDAIVKKDYAAALKYSEGMKTAQDSLATRATANKVAELNEKYKTEEKEHKIALQEKAIVNKNTTIALLISILFGVIILTIYFVSLQKRKTLESEKQNAQLYTKQLLEKTEEERKRIASDLHDSVSHELLSLKNVADGKQTETNQKIDSIINDIRSISRNLHPIMFDKIGLKASVEQLIERAQTVNDFMVTSEIDYKVLLSNSDELQVYRIIQEALSNVIKYANAMAAKITISENNNTLNIEIKDNGKGFNVNETLNSSKSFGLHNIIERSRAIGGETKITSNKNGTIVAIEINKK